MKVNKVDNPEKHYDGDLVRVKQMGNITEIRHMKKITEQAIQKISKEEFVYKATGEVKPFIKYENRASDPSSIAKSLAMLRDLINTNITDTSKVLWVTLTYKENMTDTERLYNDFRKFMQRFKYYLRNNNLHCCEYITTAEPQGRGAWHMHLLLIFPCKAPFIENKILANIWGKGFVKITSLNNVDNIGLYLSAYLGDMELGEAFSNNVLKADDNFKNVEVTGKRGNKETKTFIKGARLRLYPTGFRIFRTSRGIKAPEVIKCTNKEAMELVKGSMLTYQKTIELLDDNGNSINTINYRQFNSKRHSV